MKRLVFGDDGSSHADAAWLWVNSQPWPDWTVLVVAASGPEHSLPELPVREWIGDPRGMQLVTERRDSDPRVALASAAHDSDLLVIGARGHGLLKAMHIGSTADWLLQAPPAPTVVVRGGHRVSRVLLAVDGSPGSLAAERALLGMPWIGQTSVTAVTVAETGTDMGVAEQAAARFTGAAADVDTRFLHPDELAVFYRPRDVLLDVAQELRPDLIVVGATGLRGWESAESEAFRRTGATAAGIVHHAHCSVMVVPGG